MANPIAQALAPFVWGAGGSKKTPEQIAQEKEVAAEILMRAGNTSPVGHWTQGAARVVDALGGVIKERRANAAGEENASHNQSVIAKLLSGQATPSASPLASIPSTGASAEMATSAPAPVDLSGDQQTFIARLLPAAIEESKRTGVDPRIIVAQAAQETGWGKSAPGNNFFGIKSHGQSGGQNLATSEVINGKTVRINDSFRQFASPADSVRGYGDFILQNPRYQGLREAKGLDAQLQALGASGYATDPNYSQSVGSIARGIKLPQETASADPQAAFGAVLADPSLISAGDSQRLQAMRGPTGGSTPYSGPGAKIDTPMPVYDAEGLRMPNQGGSLTDEVAAFEQTPAYSEQFPGQQPSSSPIGQQQTVNTPQQAPMVQEVAQAQPSINPAIIEALSDPQATPQTRAIASALLQQQQGQQEQAAQQQQWMERQRYEQQQQQADPLRQLQIRKAQIEVDSANQPQRQPLINAGNGSVYDPNSGSWLQAPNSGQEKTPDSVRALEIRAERAGLKPGTAEYNQFMISGGSGGTSLSVGPNGEVNFSQGGAVKPLTEAQSKDAVYATRATNALPLLNKYEDSLLSLGENVADGIPMNLGRYAQSEEYQVARDAGRDFLATILRKDTGAAITQQEEDIYGKMFLPQPGDKAAAIQAKKQRRALAVEAIKAGMPTNAIENMAKALETVPASTDIEVQTDIPGVKIRRKN